MAAMIEDLPALGKPTSPTSAIVFSSRTRSCSWPGSPLRANPGALRRGLARAALPRPPRPPAAATNLVPTPTRSARTSPSAVFTSVPFGTGMIRSVPSAPVRLEPSPCRPLPARRTGRRWKSSSVAELASTSKITSPPRPPLPPSGPPSGLNFSRWTEAQPFPPWPARTSSVARSANSATVVPSFSSFPHGKGGPGCLARLRGCGAPRRAYAGGSAGTMLTARRPRTLPNSTLPATSANSVSSPPRPTPWPGWKCVPCWRTMISPALTSWPPKRLTPRRLALESRPLRLDDAPFLCAISVLLRLSLRLGPRPRLGCRLRRGGLGTDAGDAHLRVLLPVTQTPAVAGLVPVVDHVDLGTGGVTDDVGRDLVAAHFGGVADDPLAVDHQQGGQRDGGAMLARQLVDGHDVIERDLLLPAAAAHNRVHRVLSFVALSLRAPAHRCHDGGL